MRFFALRLQVNEQCPGPHLYLQSSHASAFFPTHQQITVPIYCYIQPTSLHRTNIRQTTIHPANMSTAPSLAEILAERAQDTVVKSVKVVAATGCPAHVSLLQPSKRKSRTSLCHPRHGATLPIA